MTPRSVLVVEDDRHMSEVLRIGLEHVGYQVCQAADGDTALQIASERSFSVMVLDVMLPGADGIEVTTVLRRLQVSTPILMLTARSYEDDIVRGLDAGASDYLTKPFSFRELLARLRVLTRHDETEATSLRAGDVMLDTASCHVTCHGMSVPLSRLQLRLLETLMRAAGRIVRRETLTQAGWGHLAYVSSNTLDVAVSSLRGALEDAWPGSRIHSVRGFGYRIEP